MLELAMALGIKLTICDVAGRDFYWGFNLDLLYGDEHYGLLYPSQVLN